MNPGHINLRKSPASGRVNHFEAVLWIFPQAGKVLLTTVILGLQGIQGVGMELFEFQYFLKNKPFIDKACKAVHYTTFLVTDCICL